MTGAVATPPPLEPGKRYRVKLDGEQIGTVSMRPVPVAIVRLDPAYQRSTNRSWLETHMPFDPKQAGAIVISNRGGTLFGIDGGHRLELARATGVQDIMAVVYEGLSQRDEARLFTRFQRERRALSAHDLYRADLTAGDPETIAMERVVRGAGFKVSTGRSQVGPKEIAAINACRRVMEIGGEELLAQTLRVIGEYWIGHEKALSGSIIRGLAIFLNSMAARAEYRRETLTWVMEHNVPLKVLAYAQENAARRVSSSTSESDVAEAFLQRYNIRAAKDLRLPALTLAGGKRRPAAKVVLP